MCPNDQTGSHVSKICAWFIEYSIYSLCVQVAPLKPMGHLQKYESRSASHTPPLRHGLSVIQMFSCTSQLVPATK